MNTAQPELPLKVVPRKRTDARALAAKVFERHGIGLNEDDPAFALVTLNELVLRKLMDELLPNAEQRFTARLAEFEQTMRRVEQRASKVLAQQVRESADGLRRKIQEETAAARWGTAEMIDQIRRAYRIAILARWCAVGAVLAIVIFACGFWAGKF
jgi:hypothetical protein